MRKSPTDARRTFEEPPRTCRERARERYKVLSYSELMGDYFGAIFTGFMGRW